MRILTATLAALTLSAGFAVAGTEGNATMYLTLDNDVFAGNDDGYTNGLQIGYVSPHLVSFADGPVPTSVGQVLDSLPLFDDPGRERFIAYSLAQRIFTPQDLSRRDVVANDLLYTGVLVVSGTIAAQNFFHLDAFTVTAGVAGPASLAASTQRVVHHAIGSDQPQGWEHQTGNEPLLNLQFEHRWRAVTLQGGGTNGDILVSGSATAGNLATMATAGVGIRWGYHVPNDFFAPPPFFGESTVGSLPWDAEDSRAHALYVVASIDGSALGNVIYLDGNTFHDSHGVSHEHWMARAHLGVHLRLAPVLFALSIVHETLPYDRPDGAHADTYGQLSVGFHF